MDRIIKFRGQNIKGEWNYGLLCHDKSKDTDYEWFISNSAGKPYAFGAIEKTIGQYTGLNDKNGVQIYEGDILDEDGFLFQVVYDVQNAKFKLKHIGPYQYPEWNRGIRMVVIGNIHSNPELLK